jgi:hypothetical protein
MPPTPAFQQTYFANSNKGVMVLSEIWNHTAFTSKYFAPERLSATDPDQCDFRRSAILCFLWMQILGTRA